MPALAALVVVTLIHLGAQAVTPGGVVADVTQVLLMPLLLWFLVTTTRRPQSLLVRLTVVALVLSWLGDTVPRFVADGSEVGFMLMLGAFLLAQLAYVAALTPFAGSSVARTRPVLVAPYAIALVVLLVVVTLGSGFRWQVALYGIAIMTMAVLATGLDRVATTGAIVFVVSDALIAVRAFADVELPLHGVWVMLTYVVGQTLLVAAIAHRDRVDHVRHV